MNLTAADIIGPWHLHRFIIRFADGRPPVLPFGPRARGQLIYTAGGHMSATLCRGERPPLGGRLETTARAPIEARAAAFDSYLAYAGRWRLADDGVIHDVEFALAPDLVGASNHRAARLEDGRLHLSYELTAKSGIVRTYHLIWRRP